MYGLLGAVDIPGTRHIDGKLLLDPSRMGGEEQDSIPQACGLPHIMRNKDYGFAAFAPDFLYITVKLFSSKCVKRGKRSYRCCLW